MRKRWQIRNNHGPEGMAHNGRGEGPRGGLKMLQSRHLMGPAAGLALLAAGVVTTALVRPALAAEDFEPPKQIEWSFDGPVGNTVLGR